MTCPKCGYYEGHAEGCTLSTTTSTMTPPQPPPIAISDAAKKIARDYSPKPWYLPESSAWVHDVETKVQLAMNSAVAENEKELNDRAYCICCKQQFSKERDADVMLKHMLTCEKSETVKVITSLNQQLLSLEAANVELRKLLAVASCPNCDGSGATQKGERRLITRDMAMDAGCPEMEGSVHSEPEIEQCQWCDERQKLLSTPTPTFTLAKIRGALQEADFEIRTHYIDWSKFNSDSSDYDKNYKPQYPEIVNVIKEALAFLPTSTDEQKEKV